MRNDSKNAVSFPSTVKEHQDNVRALRCVITDNPWPTIHHCHGGSMKDAGYHSGGAQRGCGEALIIPIKASYHVGEDGIDYGVGVLTWEAWYQTQMVHLEDVNSQLPYDIWELHKEWLKNPPRKG